MVTLARQISRCSNTTTPTAEITKIRGFSLNVLASLQNRGGLYTPEIAEELGKPRGYVRTYLHRLYQYGCVDRFGRWGWEITALGSEIIQYNNNYIEHRSITETSQKHNRSITETSHVPRTTHSSRQLDLSLFTEDPNVSEPERVVVLALASHYEKTGEKYQLFSDWFDFSDSMGISSIGVNEIVGKLKQDGVIYVRYEKMLRMIKIGLKKDFVERLQYC